MSDDAVAKDEGKKDAGKAPVVNSTTPENKDGKINPSAPEDANTTPGSTTEMLN